MKNRWSLRFLALAPVFLLPALQPAEAQTWSQPLAPVRIDDTRSERRSLPVFAPENHEADAKMKVVLTGSLLKIGSLDPRRLEAQYNRPITLSEALDYAVAQNLPIKIARESWKFQNYEFLASTGQFLPSNSVTWSLLNSHVYPAGTESNSRIFSDAVLYPVFQGGAVVYGTLAQYYRARGWRHAYHATVNDSLLKVYKDYTNLALQRALLQIRLKAKELSELQVDYNKRLWESGAGTKLAVMQYQAQLESDKQSLMEQQVAYRKASMDLAFDLDLPMSVNLIPADDTISELTPPSVAVSPAKLMSQAIANRPELKQYENFRLAAARTVQITASQFYPTIILFTQYNHISTSVTGSFAGLSGIANQNIAATQSSGILPPVTVNALGQQATFSPTSSTTANSGANTGATTIVAASGGSPTATVQSGGLVTSGGVAPALLATTGSGFGSTTGTTVGAGVFPGLFNTFQMGFQFNWLVPYAEISTAANVATARSLARQALNQANQELLLVEGEVHADRMRAATARAKIDVTAQATSAAAEALKMARIKLKAGAGTNLDVLQAQRDYINARQDQVSAIIDSCQAQAQLLHDTGLISAATLTGK